MRRSRWRKSGFPTGNVDGIFRTVARKIDKETCQILQKVNVSRIINFCNKSKTGRLFV
jgi:hypothetical protein